MNGAARWLLYSCLGVMAGLLPIAASAAEAEDAAPAVVASPWSRTKAGDWARYEIRRNFGKTQQPPSGQWLIVVTEKTDDAVTCRIDTRTMVRNQPVANSRTVTIDPNQPNDNAFGLLADNLMGEKTTTTRGESRSVPLTLAGKTFQAETTLSTFTGKRIRNGLLQTWTSDEFPFRFLKSETSMTLDAAGREITATLVTALVAFGDAEHPDAPGNAPAPVTPDPAK